MKKILFVVTALMACGPNFEGGMPDDCMTCRNNEDSAESVDGGQQIPVVVNVVVVVNQTQNQQQNQDITVAGYWPQTPVLVVLDGGSSGTDAGTSMDSGMTQDAGVDGGQALDAGGNTDAGFDAGCQPKECRLVCTEWVERQICDQGWHGSDHKGRCRPHPHPRKKCVKEEIQCL